MRNWRLLVTIGLTVVLGVIASLGIVSRNVQSLELVRAYVPLPGLSMEQLDSLVSAMGERRAAIILLGAAQRVGDVQGPDALPNQQRVLELLQDRGLNEYLAPDEKQWVIRVWSFMCEVAYDRNRFNDMLNFAERILQIAPDNPDGLVWQGTALGRLGKPNDAAALLDQATSSPAVTITALTRAADYYFFWSPNRAWKNRALPLLERALTLKPDDPAALSLLAQYRLDENHCADAVGIASRLTEISPNDSGSWMVLGNAYWCLGDKIRAQENYRRAIQITPTLERALGDRLNAP